MGRYLNPLLVQKKLKSLNFKLFSLNDFRNIFNVSIIATKKFTEEYTKRGLFLRLKRGIFILADNPPSQFLIANKLYEPSYISLDTALAHYNIIPETIYSITSATTKATRKFKTLNTLFTYQKIKKENYTGYEPIKYQGETILMAEPEKALADYLYFVSLKKRELSYERLDPSKLKKTKLLFYIKMFKHPKMIKLVKDLYDFSKRSKRIY
jgi:predicted transcriptional regulator of viral defense system